MGKYSGSVRRRPPPKRDPIPPMVRGIGCLLFALVPILGYGIASIVAPMVPGWGIPVPRDWYGPARIQNPVIGIPYLREFVDLILHQNNLIANLVFGVIITILLFGVLSIAYGYVYSLAAPSQLGPLDVPQPKIKTKKYRR